MAGGASVVVRFLANTTDLAKGAKDVEAHGSRMTVSPDCRVDVNTCRLASASSFRT